MMQTGGGPGAVDGERVARRGHSDVLIGIQYGDEGKAKVIDLIADNYDIVARFNGGANAGHTIKTPRGAIALKQLPSAIFIDRCDLYLGSGCVVNLRALTTEIEAVLRLGVDVRSRLRVSANAAIIQPHHILVDAEIGQTIGTTKNGVGPCYADRALRAIGDQVLSVRLLDLLHDRAAALRAIRVNAEATLRRYGIPYNESEIAGQTEELSRQFDAVAPFIETDERYMCKRVAAGARVLFEGAQSTTLDVMKGVQPYVTSSHTLPGYAYVGGDLSPNYHRKTIGIAKAIMSRVGNGPFATECGGTASSTYCDVSSKTKVGRDEERARHSIDTLLQSGSMFDLGVGLRMLSDEYGTGTGRPRRIGLLDLVQLKSEVEMQGVDLLVLNKVDLLPIFGRSFLKAIPVVVGYRGVPAGVDSIDPSALEIRQMPVWGEFDGAAQSMAQLPTALRDFLAFVESFVDCPLLCVGLGPERDKSILMKERLLD